MRGRTPSRHGFAAPRWRWSQQIAPRRRNRWLSGPGQAAGGRSGLRDSIARVRRWTSALAAKRPALTGGLRAWPRLPKLPIERRPGARRKPPSRLRPAHAIAAAGGRVLAGIARRLGRGGLDALSALRRGLLAAGRLGLCAAAAAELLRETLWALHADEEALVGDAPDLFPDDEAQEP
jgi:hypothetical protein